MNINEQIVSLEKYTQEMAEAVRVNRRRILARWGRDKTVAYLEKHYPGRNSVATFAQMRKWDIRQMLDALSNDPGPGPIAYLLRGYGHGLDHSLADVPNKYLTEHLVKAHQMICLKNGIMIDLRLFREIVIDAAWEVFPMRNWSEV